MPRPRKCRRVGERPDITYFKPTGIPLRDLTEVYLPLDGFEAVRLTDYQGLGREEAAEKMGVSRQTLGRILAKARQTISRALVEGIALKIHGGDYELRKDENTQGFVETGGTKADIKECSAMSKIAVTTEGPTLEDRVDPRFGRAAGFLIVNTDDMSVEYMDNGASQARAQGAGIQAAENVAKSGVEAVLTGYVGPKAFQVLQAAGVKIAQDMENKSVKEAIECFQKGDVSWANASDAKGMGPKFR